MSVEFQELIRLGLKDLTEAIRENKWNDRDRDYFVQEIYRTLKTLSGVPPGGPAGGDLTGTYPSPTIAANAVTTTKIIDDAVTFAKMQEITTDRLIGRDTASTGNPEELTVSGGVEFTGSGGIQRSALTGMVTASAGSNTTDISLSFLSATSSEKSVGSDQDWLAMTGNLITLTAGTWLVQGQIIFSHNGSDPDYDNLAYVISTGNGADDANKPTAISTTGNVTLKAGITDPEAVDSDTGLGGSVIDVSTADILRKYNKTVPTVCIAVSANTDVYLVPYVDSAGTATNARVTTNIWAVKLSSATS